MFSMILIWFECIMSCFPGWWWVVIFLLAYGSRSSIRWGFLLRNSYLCNISPSVNFLTEPLSFLNSWDSIYVGSFHLCACHDIPIYQYYPTELLRWALEHLLLCTKTDSIMLFIYQCCLFQIFVHLLGTFMKYLSIALMNLFLYSGGWIMVGASLPTAIGILFPTLSICFRMSYWRMKSIIPTTSSFFSSSIPTSIE